MVLTYIVHFISLLILVAFASFGLLCFSAAIEDNRKSAWIIPLASIHVLASVAFIVWAVFA